jgi:uncharacterized protein
MRIGVVSDTHGYLDPGLSSLLQGVDEILHAGDVGLPLLLDQLRAIAPVQAVRGNVDGLSRELPHTLTRRYGSVEIYMLHQLPGEQAILRGWAKTTPRKGKQTERCGEFLDCFPHTCRVVIFGHSHIPCSQVLAGRLFFNPGSAGKRRFSLPRCCGLLEVSREGVRATFIGLEQYNKDLPGDVWLPLGGP